MNRDQALPYVSCTLDDALNVIRPPWFLKPDAVLVGWQCGFEPMFVAVQSYLPGVVLSPGDAVEIATDYLEEKGWFADEPTEPDYVIGGKS